MMNEKFSCNNRDRISPTAHTTCSSINEVIHVVDQGEEGEVIQTDSTGLSESEATMHPVHPIQSRQDHPILHPNEHISLREVIQPSTKRLKLWAENKNVPGDRRFRNGSRNVSESVPESEQRYCKDLRTLCVNGRVIKINKYVFYRHRIHI